MKDLVIDYRSPAQLKRRKRSYRKHSDKQIEFSANIIRRHGTRVPILVDDGNEVVDGELILLAARQVGLNRVPVIQLSDMSEGELRRYGLALNRLAALTEIDEYELGLELADILEILEDPDLTGIGFEQGELDRLLGLTEPGDGDASDQIPDIDPSRPVAKLGDLWLLDRHRLLCGDALEPQNYALLMDGEQAQLGFSDVPYNVPATAISGNGKHKHEDFVQGSGEMSSHEFTRFLRTAMTNMREVSQDGSLHMIFMSWHHLLELLRAGKIVFDELKNIVTWVKQSGGMGSLYRSQTEFVAIFKHGSATHINNVQLGRFGRNRTNAWHYDGLNGFGKERDELLALHPTVKPRQLVADAILDASHRDGIVLDPFVGSGTTIMAAQATDRRCHAMELDPLYVDVTLRRFIKEFGIEPVHVASGMTFSQAEEASHEQA